MSYFVCVGETAEWIVDGTNLRVALEHAHFKDPKTDLPETITWQTVSTGMNDVE
jgi:hypothetical protein